MALLEIFATTLLQKTPLSVLCCTHLPGLINGVRHHLLLFKALANVVAIQTQIALLTETQKDLRAEAASND